MKPALSAEGWGNSRRRIGQYSERVFEDDDGDLSVGADHPFDPSLFDASGRHALAALCLFGQEFGFTRDDVKNVRDAVGAVWNTSLSEVAAPWGRGLESLADRIEALLPTKEEG